MLRVVVPALVLSACAYDYDGAFGGTGAGDATASGAGWVNSVWMRVTYAPTCIP